MYLKKKKKTEKKKWNQCVFLLTYEMLDQDT